MTFETPLCEIAYKYGTDKCPQIKHVYTPFYYNLFKDRTLTVKKVVEMGIGNKKDMVHVENYRPGASLFMWREFFPAATIYGADIDRETMIYDEPHIYTDLVDETDPDDVNNWIERIGIGIDIFVDDGSHEKEHQMLLCKTVMPLLDRDAVYIIEDVAFPDTITRKLSEYRVECPYLPNRKHKKGKLLVVRHR